MKKSMVMLGLVAAVISGRQLRKLRAALQAAVSDTTVRNRAQARRERERPGQRPMTL